MMDAPLYHLNGIRHYYGDKKALSIDDLKIEKGAITSLIGPNGSGKSTLMKILAFAQKPTQGRVLYKGKAQVPFSPEIRARVTLLTQKPYLLKRSVFDNIAYGLKIRKTKGNIESRVRKALSAVGLDFETFAGRRWQALSGGEAQRVAMAARLVLEPEVLLLDEPIASVDAESAKRIREASLNARSTWGTTLVIVSHDIQWLQTISDTTLSIVKGNIFSSGMENVITGPFESANGKFRIKRLGDGQKITLDAPQKASDTAVIRKKNIRITPGPAGEFNSRNLLTGKITSMMLEKKGQAILATVLCHDLSLVVRLEPDQINSLSLYPGREVNLSFDPADVEWL